MVPQKVVCAALAVMLLCSTHPAHGLVTTPWGGEPFSIPGVLEVKNFDEPGDVAAYSTSQTTSSIYRSDTTLIFQQNSNGVQVRLFGEEWMSYTVRIAATGWYDVLPYVCRTTSTAGAVHLTVSIGSQATLIYDVPAESSCALAAFSLPVDRSLAQTVELTEGDELTLNISATTTSVLDHARIGSVYFFHHPPAPFTAHAHPTLEAEDYDSGIFGFRTATAFNVSGENSTYRTPMPLAHFVSGRGDGAELVRVTSGDWLNWTVAGWPAGFYHPNVFAVFDTSSDSVRLRFRVVGISVLTGTMTSSSPPRVTNFEGGFVVTEEMSAGSFSLAVEVVAASGAFLDKLTFTRVPFTHPVPGVVEAEAFGAPADDFSVALGTTLSTRFRRDSKMVIEANTYPGAHRIRLSLGESVTYKLDVVTPGVYDVVVMGYRTTFATTAPLVIRFDDEAEEFTLPLQPLNSFFKTAIDLPSIDFAAGARTRMTIRAEENAMVSQTYVIDRILILEQRAPFKDHHLPGEVNATDYDRGFSWASGSPLLDPASNATATAKRPHFIATSFIPALDRNVLSMKSGELVNFTVATVPTGMYLFAARAFSPLGGSLTAELGETLFTTGTLSTGSFYGRSRPQLRRRLGVNNGDGGAVVSVRCQSSAVHLLSWQLDLFDPRGTIPGVIEAEDFGTAPGSALSLRSAPNSPLYRDDTNLTIGSRSSGNAFAINMRVGDNATYPLTVSTTGEFLVIVLVCAHLQPSSYPGQISLRFGEEIEIEREPQYESACQSSGPRGLMTGFDGALAFSVTLDTSITSLTIAVADSTSPWQQYFIDALLIDKAGASAENLIPGTIEFEDYDFSLLNAISTVDRERGNSSYRAVFIHPHNIHPPNNAETVLMRPGSTAVFTVNVTQSGWYNMSLIYFQASSSTSKLELRILINGELASAAQIDSGAGWQRHVVGAGSGIPLFNLPNGTLVTIEMPSSAANLHTSFERIDFDLLAIIFDESDDVSEVRYSVSDPIAFINYSSAMDTTIINQGNESQVRPGSRVDISTCLGCYSGYAVHFMDDSEELRYLLSNDVAGVYNMSVSMASFVASYSNVLGPSWKVFVNGQEEYPLEVQTRGGLAAPAPGQGRDGNMWNYTLGPVYLPEGNITLTFVASASGSLASSQTPLLFFDQFSFLLTRKPFSHPQSPMNRLLEAEHYDFHADENATQIEPKDAGTGADFRDDLLHPLQRNDSDVFVDFGPSNAAHYTVYMSPGTFRLRFRLRTTEPDKSSARMAYRIGKWQSNADPWTTPIVVSTTVTFNPRENSTFEVQVSQALTIARSGIYQLELAATASALYSNVSLDYAIFLQTAGLFGERPATIPGALVGYRADFGTNVDLSPENLGTHELRHDGLDTSFDVSFNDIVLVAIQEGEAVSFTTDVSQEGRYAVYFSGQVSEQTSKGNAGLIEMRINGSSYFGYLRVEAPGLHDRTLVGFVSLPAAGRSLIRLAFRSERFVTFYSLEFVEAPATAPVSVLPDGILTAGILNALEFDEGGRGVAYEMSNSMVSVNRDNGRSGEVINTIGVDSLQFGRLNVQWASYTFRVATDITALVSVRIRGSVPLRLVTTLAFMNASVNPPPQTNRMADVSIGRFAFVAGVTYQLNVSIPDHYGFSGSTFLQSIAVDSSILMPLPPTCFETSTLAEAGCGTRGELRTTCAALAAGAIPFGDPFLPGANNEITHCVPEQIGKPQTLNAPQTALHPTAAVVHLTRSSVMDVVRVPHTFQIDDTWSNGVIAVTFTSSGYAVSAVVNRETLETRNFGRTFIRFELTSGGLAGIVAGGSSSTPLFSGFGITRTALVNCEWLFTTSSNDLIDLHDPADARWDLFRSWCVDFSVNDPRSKVDVLYDSGRAERVGTFVSQAADLPSGFVATFAPLARSTTVIPLSNCGKNETSPSNASAESLETSSQRTLPVVAIPLSPRGDERAIAIRFTNYDAREIVAVAGIAWLRPDASCTPPTPSTNMGLRLMLRGIEFLGGVVQSSLLSDPASCAAACALDVTCAAWTLRLPFSFPQCSFSAAVIAPESSLAPFTTVPATAMGFARTAEFTEVHVPHLMERTMLMTITFPPSSGWRAFFIPGTAPSSFRVRNVRGLALSVTEFSFVRSTDYVVLMSDFGYAKQCGNAYDPFDRPEIVGERGIFGGAQCEEFGVATCGRASFPNPPSAEHSVYVFWSPRISVAHCDSPYSVLHLQGDVLPVGEPVLFEAVRTTATSLSSVPGLIRDVQRPAIGSGYIFRQLEGPEFFSTPRSSSPLRLACEFSSASGFEIWNGVTGDALITTCDGGFDRVTDIAAACDADPQCVGFTTATSANANELPRCLQYATRGIERSVRATELKFYAKRRPTGLSCNYTATAPVAAAALDVTFGDWALPSQFITVLVNDAPRFRCGGIYGFHDVSQPTRSTQCGRLAKCFDGPLFLQQGDVLKIAIEPSVSVVGSCPYAAVALLTLTGTNKPYFELLASMQHRLWRLSSTGASDHHVRFNKLEDVALQYISLADGSTYSGSLNRFDLIITRREPTFALPSVIVDDGENATAPADPHENTLGANATIRCAGWIFPSVDGLTLRCGDPMLCTNVTEARSAPPFTTPFAPIRGDVLLRHKSSNAWLCTTGVNAITVTSGALAYTGVPVLTFVERSIVRAFRAVRGTFEQVQGNASALLESLGGRFDPPSDPQNLRVWWSELGVQHSFRASLSAASPPVAYVLYDDVSVATARPGSEAFCVIDTFMDRGINVGCKTALAAENNYVSVKVAQTLFADPRFTVMVTLGPQQQVVCGGGRSFNGVSSRLSGQCNLYLTCFEGRVPGAAGEVTVMFSTPTAPVEECSPAASALIEQRNVDFAATTCPATSLTCHVDGKCIAAGQICDGAVDCSDGSDEAKCSSWRLVSRGSFPRCESNATLTSTTVISFDDCVRWAIASSSVLVDAPPSMGILFEENRHCVALTCLNFQEPQLFPIPPSHSGTLFYANLEVVSEFRGCTDDLSCDGKGTVASFTQPCRCKCREGYLGEACESRRNMAAIADMLLVTQPRISAEDEEAVAQIVQGALAARRITGLQVEIRAFEPSRAAAGASRAFKKLDNGNGATEVGHYTISMVSLGQSTERDEALLFLSTAGEQKSLAAAISAGIPSANVTEIAAVSALQLSRSLSCTTSATTIDGTSRRACSASPPSEKSDNAILLDYAVTFHGIASAGLTPSGHLVDGSIVPCSDITETIDLSKPEECQVSTVCYKALNVLVKDMTFRPSVDETATACEGGAAQIPVTISYRVLVPPPKSTVRELDAVTVEISRTDSADDALLGVYVCCGFFGVFSMLTFQANRVDARMRRAVFAVATTTTVMIALVLSGVYLDGEVVSPSHDIFMDEYRTPKCSQSAQPMPHRITRLPADSSCHRVEVAGPSEGTFYAKGSCASSTGRTDGRVRVFVGRTVDECKEGSLEEYLRSTCMEESTLFPSKTPDELHFMELDCFSAKESDERWRIISEEFNPPIAPAESVTPDAVPNDVRFAPGSGTTTYFRGRALTRLPTLFGSTEEVSVASISNANTSLIGSPDNVEWEGRAPRHTASDAADSMSNTAELFSGHGTSTPLADSLAAGGAYRFLGVAGTPFDIGARDAFTITFWLRASNQSRGFALVVADGWFERSTLSSPIIERVLELLQNGQGVEQYFERDWNLYFGVYVNGQAGTISLIYASPLNEEAKVEEMTWDLNVASVDAGDVFDDEWRFFSIGFTKVSGQHLAQLFIDGRTSYTEAGWRVCFPRGEFVKPVRNPTAAVLINDAVAESVHRDGMMYVGHLNAGVFDVQVHGEFLAQEAIIALGAPGMERHATILVDESRLLGRVLLGGFGLFSLIAIVFVVLGIRHNMKLADEESAEDATVVVDKGKRGKRSATQAANVKTAARRGASASRGASQMKYMIPAVINTAQTLAIYFSGWRWPVRFEVSLSWLVSWLAFDINLAFPELPAIVSPAIQVFAAVCIVMILLSLIGNDHDRYVHQMSASGADELPTASTHCPHFSLRFTLKKHFVITGASRELLTRILFKMWRRLDGTEPLVWSEKVPLTAHFKKPANGEYLLVSTVMIERRRATGNHAKVTVTVDADPGDSSTGRRAVEGFTAELHCDLEGARGVCPHHGDTLIVAVDSIHKQVRDAEGKSPYSCGYGTLVGTLYRMLHKNTAMMTCPGIEGSHGNFFVCPHDDCNFAVCTECNEGGLFTKVFALVGSKVYTASRLGMLATVGFVVLLIAQSLHMPIMKNALMIIYCAPQFQCLFPRCWTEPTTQFLIFVAYATIIALLMGVGLVVFLVINVLRRKAFIQKNMPDVFEEDGSMSHVHWLGLLMRDNSMLKNVYEPFTFRFMWVQPLTLIFKLATVLPIVFAEPNSLTQLTLASFAEAVHLIFFIVTNPFADHWIGFLEHIGSLHTILQLALMCFYRVAVFLDPSDDAIADYMFLAAAAYVVLLVVILVFGVIAPAVREYLEQRRQTDSKRRAAAAELRAGDDQTPASPPTGSTAPTAAAGAQRAAQLEDTFGSTLRGSVLRKREYDAVTNPNEPLMASRSGAAV